MTILRNIGMLDFDYQDYKYPLTLISKLIKNRIIQKEIWIR